MSANHNQATHYIVQTENQAKPKKQRRTQTKKPPPPKKPTTTQRRILTYSPGKQPILNTKRSYFSMAIFEEPI
jgi:hypothetical protein